MRQQEVRQYLVLRDDVAGEVQQAAELQAVGDNTKRDMSRRVPVQHLSASGKFCYLDLLPSLANLDEEASRCRHICQGSLCVALRVLHHGVARRKSLELKEAER